MRYYEILRLVEGFREVERKYVEAGADKDQVKKAIEVYRELVNKNQVKGNERNIDWWGKNKGFDEFTKFIDSKANAPTMSQTKKVKNAGKSINLVENDKWLVVIPLDKDASCFHGKETDWCTTKPGQNYFNDYFYDKRVILIYCLNKQDGSKWAIAGHRQTERLELFDQADKTIKADEFERATGFNPLELFDLAVKKYEPEINNSQKYSQQAAEAITEFFSQYGNDETFRRDAKIEKDLTVITDAEPAAKYLQLCARTKADMKSISLSVWKKGVSAKPVILMIASMSAPPKYLEEIQLTAIEAFDDEANQYIVNPSPKVQVAMVETWSEAILAMDDPCDEAVIAAVNKNHNLLDDLVDRAYMPSDTVLQALGYDKNYLYQIVGQYEDALEDCRQRTRRSQDRLAELQAEKEKNLLNVQKYKRILQKPEHASAHDIVADELKKAEREGDYIDGTIARTQDFHTKTKKQLEKFEAIVQHLGNKS